MRKRVGILYDNISGNTGDQAIGISVRRMLAEMGVEFEELVIGRFNPEDYETIIVGGGHLLIPSPNPFYDKFRAPGAHILNCCGTLGSPDDLHYLNDYLYVSVRSSGDRQKLSCLSREVKVVPCTSMLLGDLPDFSLEIRQPSIGVHLWQGLVDEEPLVEFLSGLPFHVYFLPITHYNHDFKYLAQLSRKVKGSTPLPILEPEEILTITGKFNCLISASLHGAMFAYIHNVPFMLLETGTDKMRFFLEDRGLSKYLVTNCDELKAAFETLASKPPDYSRSLEKDFSTLQEHKDQIADILRAKHFVRAKKTGRAKPQVEFDSVETRLQQTTSQIHYLRKQVEALAAQARDLESGLEEKSDQVNGLITTLQAKDAQVAELGSTLQAKDAQVAELGSALQAEDAQVAELGSALQAEDAQVAELGSVLQEKMSRIGELEASLQGKVSRIHDLEFQIQQIQQGIVVQLLNRYQRVVEKLLRPGTRRRLYYELGLTGIRVILNEGWRSFWSGFRRWLRRQPIAGKLVLPQEDRYQLWIAENEPNERELERQKQESISFEYRPKISIIIPVWNPEARWLRAAIESVINQTYDNWELCIADGRSTKAHVKQTLKEYAKKDARIKVKFLRKNKGISGNSNEALSLASGEFIGLLDHDDDLAPFALYEIAKLLNETVGADFIYSDEDKVDTSGDRFAPFFKPDWSPDLLNSYMYTGHFTVYSKQLIEDCGRFRSEYDFSQDYDLALRASEKARCIAHIPKVLYHWRAVPGSAAAAGKTFARASNIASLESAVVRRGYTAKAIVAREPHWVNRIKFTLTEFPFISIIIPTDSKENITRCVDNILQKTRYPNFEVVVVTNSELAEILSQCYTCDPRVLTVKFDKLFNFSAKCNLGASQAKGEYLLFLNDDMQVVEEAWLEEMVEIFQRPEVGAVGAKLIYPDNTVQHAGLVTGVRGLVGTAFHCQPKDANDYFYFIQSTRNVSALSAACLLVPKRIFKSIGGFDETNTPIRHSDIDLCFRLREKGYLLVYTPFATLEHTGHVSLGKAAKDEKGDSADLYLLKKWPKYMADDPYYTRNMRELLYDDSAYRYKLLVNEKPVPDYSGKNILLISQELSLTGAPIFLYNLASYLFKQNNFVTVMSPHDGDLASKYTELGIPVMIDTTVLENPLYETKRFMADFDLIIANTIHSWRSIYIGREKGIPVIWLIHEPEWGRRFAGRNGSIIGAFDVADRVVFSSNTVADMYKEFSKRDNFEILYYGMDIPEFADITVTKEEGKFYVLCAASVEPRKGQDILVRCVLDLPSDVLKNCEFYIVGRTVEPGYYREIRRLADPLSNVHFVEHVPYEELFRFYKMADVYVCASREEVLPLTILEAMSQGKAIISSSIGGIPEVIENEKDGILIPKEDVNALKTGLINLYKDARLRNRLGANALRKFQKSFTLEKYGAKFLEMTRELVAIREVK